MTEAQPRRLAAILAADIAGYSALMGADEERTVRDLKGHQAVLLPMIGEHGGRIIDTAGDGILAEFPSVMNSIKCALAIQDTMAKRNADIDPARRMQFRIGINQGDVMHDDARIYGDGVNIAARLETLSEAGGICISGKVHDEVLGRITLAVDDLGEQQLKNIARPVRVYRVRFDATAERASVGSPDQPPAEAVVHVPPPSAGTTRRSPLWIAAGAAIAVALAAVTGLALIRGRANVTENAATSRPTAISRPPIIAVLPFANQTGDESQDYFVDGVTDEVIGALGRFKTLRVIGRSGVLRFKKRAPTHAEITTELGANYLVSGSVRHSGKSVRIAAELTEPQAGTVMWSERYDGERSEVFEFQDSIARRIAGTLAASITQFEGRQRLDRPKPNPTAFDFVLRARAIGHTSSRAANRQFRELIAKAIEQDPTYAAARALLAEALHSQVTFGWTEFPDRALTHGADEARKAIEMASGEPDGHRALGRILLARGELDQAQNALKRVIEINPSDANALAAWGAAQLYLGEISGAIQSLQLALSLDLMLEQDHVFDLAIAFYLARRHEDALRVAERGLAQHSEWTWGNVPAAAAAAQLGRSAQAARHAEVIRRRIPLFDLDSIGSRFRDPTLPAYLREGLKSAGL